MTPSVWTQTWIRATARGVSKLTATGLGACAELVAMVVTPDTRSRIAGASIQGVLETTP